VYAGNDFYFYDMYETTREQASSILGLSTRSIDRYIRAGKLRAKKEGKIVYIHADDIENFSGNTRQEILQSPPKNTQENLQTEVSLPKSDDIGKIFEVMQSQIAKKDQEIASLNMELGKMQEVVKNSISLVEFRKSQFLLESGKNHLTSELQNAQGKIQEQTEILKEEKMMNTVLLVICMLLFVTLV